MACWRALHFISTLLRSPVEPKNNVDRTDQQEKSMQFHLLGVSHDSGALKEITPKEVARSKCCIVSGTKRGKWKTCGEGKGR